MQLFCPSSRNYDPNTPKSFYLPRLGEMLIAANLTNDQDVQRALEFQNRFGGRLGAILIRMGAVSEDSILTVLAKQLNLPIIDNHHIPFDANLLLETIEKTGIEKDCLLTPVCVLLLHFIPKFYMVRLVKGIFNGFIGCA